MITIVVAGMGKERVAVVPTRDVRINPDADVVIAPRHGVMGEVEAAVRRSVEALERAGDAGEHRAAQWPRCGVPSRWQRSISARILASIFSSGT